MDKTGGYYYFWLGAEGDLARVSGSSSLRSPEPLCVSAHTGDDPARIEALLTKHGAHLSVPFVSELLAVLGMRLRVVPK